MNSVDKQPAVSVIKPKARSPKKNHKERAGQPPTVSGASAGPSGKSIRSRTMASSAKRVHKNPDQVKWRKVALDTCQILDNKTLTINGKTMDLTSMIKDCITNTRFYAPQCVLVLKTHLNSNDFHTRIHVTQETSLAACYRIAGVSGKRDVACLNFASAVDPGGMFRDGTNTQEDSLARSSALFVSLDSETGKQMYRYNRANQSRDRGIHSDAMIYSPDVPVFKDDAGSLEAPYRVSFITAPAVDKTLCQGVPELQIQEAMQTRGRKILTVAVNNGVKHLILGAWGCGIFGHNAADIANLFYRLLAEDDFQGRFVSVTFAITDAAKLQIFNARFSEELSSVNPGSVSARLMGKY